MHDLARLPGPAYRAGDCRLTDIPESHIQLKRGCAMTFEGVLPGGLVYVPLIFSATFLHPSPGAGDEAGVHFDAVSDDAWTGEPYALLGNRMVFTSWYYVRPGAYGWSDEQGNNVTASRRVKAGPWDAHLVRGDDMAYGVRLIAERAEHRGPVLKREKPWEKMGVSINIVLREGETYRGWGT